MCVCVSDRGFVSTAADSSGGAQQPKPQRVTKDAPVSVRTQIKYAKMRKSMEKTSKSSKKMVNNKYRRVKPLDYEDVRNKTTKEKKNDNSSMITLFLFFIFGS